MSELAAYLHADASRSIFRLENDFVQPWLKGFTPPVFNTYWKYLDIDLELQQRARQQLARASARDATTRGRCWKPRKRARGSRTASPVSA